MIIKRTSEIQSVSLDSYTLPSIKSTEQPENINCSDKAIGAAIALRLAEFYNKENIDASVVEYNVSYQVIQCLVKLGEKTKASKLIKAEHKLAELFGTGPVQVRAPYNGKNLVSVEIPRETQRYLPLGELLTSEEFLSAESNTAVCLGRDLEGKIVIRDIEKMAHIMIGGATGMGKTVMLDNIIASILMKARPDEVKLVLFDPKMVEFTKYAQIPHLYMPIMSGADEAMTALALITDEMERRFDLLRESNQIRISEYNKTAEVKLPKIILIFDEIADYAIEKRDDFISIVAQMAQKGRSAGIHLILATQRPARTVFSRFISCNVPTKICLRVSTATDSRVCIDQTGGEKLVGRGDAIICSQGEYHRMQTALFSESELSSIINQITEQTFGQPLYDFGYVGEGADDEEADEENNAPFRFAEPGEEDEGDLSITMDRLDFWNMVDEPESDEKVNVWWPDVLQAADRIIDKKRVDLAEISESTASDRKTSEELIRKLTEFGLLGNADQDGYHDIYLTKAGWKNKVDELLADGADRKLNKANVPSANRSAVMEKLAETAGDKDFLQLVDLVIESDRISTSLVQRRLGIGYGKSAMLIDLMEEIGFVSPIQNGRHRYTLLDRDEWATYYNGISTYKAKAEKMSENSEDFKEKLDTLVEFMAQDTFLEAVNVAISTGWASTAILQRRLSIGFGKAAKYIDAMETLGFVTPKDGAKPREVLIDQGEWCEYLNLAKSYTQPAQAPDKAAVTDGEGEGETLENYKNDKNFIDAVEVAVAQGAVSTALLQRKLGIGFGKAARSIDIMEALGYVTGKNGAKPREVLISAEDWKKLRQKYNF